MFILILYTFRATMCSSSGESIVSIRHLAYITLCRWPSCMQVWMELSHPHLDTRRSPTQSDICQMSYWISWWWAPECLKRAENWNKHIWKRTVRQVGYLQELHRDPRSTEHKTYLNNCCETLQPTQCPKFIQRNWCTAVRWTEHFFKRLNSWWFFVTTRHQWVPKYSQLCTLVQGSWRFAWICCLHLHCRTVKSSTDTWNRMLEGLANQ